jgi:hypothetical protein
MSTSSPEINALLANLGVGQRGRGGVGAMDEESSGPGSLVDVPMTEVSAILNNGTSFRLSSKMLGEAIRLWRVRTPPRYFQRSFSVPDSP